MKKNLLLIILISLIALLSRFIPHAPNFSPLASIMLFAAVYSKNRKYILLPLVALFISDIFIGFYKWQIMLSVYSSLTITALLGYYLKRNLNILNIISASMASALIFFLLSNFAVWHFGTWYNHDLNGLMLNYTLAIPFFKSSLLSNIFYSGFMFASYEFFKAYQAKIINQNS